MSDLLDAARWFVLMLGVSLLITQGPTWALIGLSALSGRICRRLGVRRRSRITIVDGVIRWHLPLRRPRQRSLATLRSAAIITTDDGPLATDIFWVLVGPEETPLVVPFLADPEGVILRALQALPGFDNEAVTCASVSVENATFTCWTRLA